METTETNEPGETSDEEYEESTVTNGGDVNETKTSSPASGLLMPPPKFVPCQSRRESDKTNSFVSGDDVSESSSKDLLETTVQTNTKTVEYGDDVSDCISTDDFDENDESVQHTNVSGENVSDISQVQELDDEFKGSANSFVCGEDVSNRVETKLFEEQLDSATDIFSSLLNQKEQVNKTNIVDNVEKVKDTKPKVHCSVPKKDICCVVTTNMQNKIERRNAFRSYIRKKMFKWNTNIVNTRMAKKKSQFVTKPKQKRSMKRSHFFATNKHFKTKNMKIESVDVMKMGLPLRCSTPTPSIDGFTVMGGHDGNRNDDISIEDAEDDENEDEELNSMLNSFINKPTPKKKDINTSVADDEAKKM